MNEPLDGQESMFDRDGWYGKTYPELCQAPVETTKAKTSPPSLKKSSKLRSREPLCLCLSRTEDGRTPGAYTLKTAPGALLTGFTTPSFGERPSTLMDECAFSALPNGVAVSRLSQILEVCPPPKYSLSAKACRGILNRAEKRGKALPPELKAALEAQSME